jgi:predicted oxidoreductase
LVDVLLHRFLINADDEIAEAVTQLKSEGKIIDFGLSNFDKSNRGDSTKTTVSYNQVQFSMEISDHLMDSSFDYMQLPCHSLCLGIPWDLCLELMFPQTRH